MFAVAGIVRKPAAYLFDRGIVARKLNVHQTRLMFPDLALNTHHARRNRRS